MTYRKSFVEFMRRLKCGMFEHPGNSIAMAITAFFIFLFSIFSVLQYLSLGDSGYDLGMHAQVLESFLHGGFFYSPLIGESLLAEHFTIFEFFQVPVYALYQSPVSLLIFEDVFVALGGFVLYSISKLIFKKHTKSLLSLEIISISFLLVYEMSPYTQSLVSFPFHSMAFLPFFFLLVIYAFLTERRILHFFSLGMIVTLHSNFIYIVAVILLYEMLFLRTHRGRDIRIWLSSRHNPRGIAQFSFFIVFITALYAYLVFSGLMKGYLSGDGFSSLLPGTGASGAASDSPVGLMMLLVRNPHSFFPFISANLGEKVFYTTFIFKNTSFLSFLSPLTLIMTIPYLLYAFPSSYPSYYELGYQYGSMLLGPVFLGAVMGVCNISIIAEYMKSKWHSHTKIASRMKSPGGKVANTEKKVSAVAFISVIGAVLIVLSIVVIPYGIFSPGDMQQRPYGSYMQDINSFSFGNASFFLMKESADMPSNAYILTENTLMPYFSNHLNTYSTPWSPGIYGNLSKFTYLVFQYNSFWATTSLSVPPIQTIAMTGLENGTYKIVASCPSYEIFVLERT